MGGSFKSNVGGWFRSLFAGESEERRIHGSNAANFVLSYFSNLGSNFMFPYMNYVRGFPKQGMKAWLARKIPNWIFKSSQEDDRFYAPVEGETIGVVRYGEIASAKGWGHVVDKYPYFENYYTGRTIPTNEDNKNHAKGIWWLDTGMAFAERTGHDPIKTLYEMNPRIKYDKEALIKVTWDGFTFFGPRDIKYASNGVFGWDVMDQLLEDHQTNDALGVLMTYSVFAAHLVYKEENGGYYEIDLEWLEEFEPLPEYAGIGGKATFEFEDGLMKTKTITWAGEEFVRSVL